MVIWGVPIDFFGYFIPGVPIHRAIPNYYAIDMEDIASRFNLKAFLWLLCVL